MGSYLGQDYILVLWPKIGELYSGGGGGVLLISEGVGATGPQNAWGILRVKSRIWMAYWEDLPHIFTGVFAILRYMYKEIHCSQTIYYFAKSLIFAKYIGHRGLSVCLFVCLFVCLSVCSRSTGHTTGPIGLILWQLMYSGSRTIQIYFFKSDESQGHHFCENHIMGHNFWTRCGRDLWLVA